MCNFCLELNMIAQQDLENIVVKVQNIYDNVKNIEAKNKDINKNIDFMTKKDSLKTEVKKQDCSFVYVF